MLEAPKDRALLVCRGATVWVVPDAALGLKDEPFLVVRPVGPTALTVGRKETIKLVPHDPKVGMKLDTAPAGVELTKEGALTWTPTGPQVGPHRVTVEVSAGGRRATLG